MSSPCQTCRLRRQKFSHAKAQKAQQAEYFLRLCAAVPDCSKQFLIPIQVENDVTGEKLFINYQWLCCTNQINVATNMVIENGWILKIK
jgi:hypothetical protein